MSETKTPVAPKSARATKLAAAAAKVAKHTNGKSPEYGMEKSKDVPWCDKKVTLFKTLKKMGAISDTTAKSTAQIVEKSGGLTARDVRHYSYHAKAAGLIGVADIEGVVGYCFYLTAKGAKVDPAKALKDQNTAVAE